MNVKQYDGEAAINWIDLHSDVTWGQVRYDSNSRRFVLGAFKYRPATELGYLVLRETHYIRFAEGLSPAKLIVGPDSWQRLRRPLPILFDPLDFEIVVIQGEQFDACVLCKSFSLYVIEEVQ